MVLGRINATKVLPSPFFKILCSWDRASQFFVSECPTRCNYTQFILSVNCSTCSGWILRPSSGAQITVSTASGTSQPLLLPVAMVGELKLYFHYCGGFSDR